MTVGLLCRRPDARGSIASDARRTQPGEQAARVCAATAYLYREPGRLFTGTMFKGQPLSIARRSRSGAWARVITDTRNRGWVEVGALCK